MKRFRDMSGKCASFGEDTLYPIQGIMPNPSLDLVPKLLCYCCYYRYGQNGTADSGCFTTIMEQPSGKYYVDYIEI